MKNKNNDLPENQKPKRLKKNLQSGKSQQRKLKKQPASLLDENLSSLGVSKGPLAEMRTFQKKKREWDLVIGDRFTSPLMGFQNQIKNATANARSMRGMSNMMGLGVAAEVQKLQDKIFNGSYRIPKSYSSAIAGSLSISDTAPGIAGLWNNSLGNFNLNSTMASAIAVTGPLAVSGAVARVMEQAHKLRANFYPAPKSYLFGLVKIWKDDSRLRKTAELYRSILESSVGGSKLLSPELSSALTGHLAANKAALEIFRGQSNLFENFRNDFNFLDRFGRAVKSDFDLDQTAPIDETAQAPAEKSKQAAIENHLEEDHRLNVAPPMERQMDLADEGTTIGERLENLERRQIANDEVLLKILEKVQTSERQNEDTHKRVETIEKELKDVKKQGAFGKRLSSMLIVSGLIRVLEAVSKYFFQTVWEVDWVNLLWDWFERFFK